MGANIGMLCFVVKLAVTYVNSWRIVEENIAVFDALRCCGFFLLNSIFCLDGVLKVSSGGNPVHKKRNSSYSAMLTLLQD